MSSSQLQLGGKKKEKSETKPWTQSRAQFGTVLLFVDAT